MGIQSYNNTPTLMAFAATSAGIGADMRLGDQGIHAVEGNTQAELDAKVSAIYSEMTKRAEGHNIGYVMGECLRKCIEESFSLKDKEETNDKNCLELCSEEVSPECHVTEGTRLELLELLKQTPFDSEEYQCLIKALHQEDIKPKHPIDLLVDLPIEMQREIREKLVEYGASPEQIRCAFTSSIYHPCVTLNNLPFRFHNAINFVFLRCSIDTAKVLAERGADVDRVCFSCASLPVKILVLEYFHANPQIRKKASRALLLEAVGSDDVKSAEKLLSLRITGANEVNFEQPLFWVYADPENLRVAIRRENVAMISLLLKYGAKSSDGRSILQIVASNQQYDFLEKLLKTGIFSADGDYYSEREILKAIEEVSSGVVFKVFRAAVTSFFPGAYAESDSIKDLLSFHLPKAREKDDMIRNIRKWREERKLF